MNEVVNMALMLASQFAKQYFESGSRPSPSTLRRWIEKGDLPGKRIGCNYYVDAARFSSDGDDLLARILSSGASA